MSPVIGRIGGSRDRQSSPGQRRGVPLAVAACEPGAVAAGSQAYRPPASRPRPDAGGTAVSRCSHCRSRTAGLATLPRPWFAPADAGWRIAEVGVDYLPRRGRSKVTGSPLGAWRAVRDMSAALQSTACTMTDHAATVIVLAKEPVPGRVKTRLQPVFSATQAARLAAAALGDTVAATRSCGATRRILAWEGNRASWQQGFEVISQPPGTLNDRLTAAFAAAVSEPMDRPALLIGMDTPQVTARAPGQRLGRSRRSSWAE